MDYVLVLGKSEKSMMHNFWQSHSEFKRSTKDFCYPQDGSQIIVAELRQFMGMANQFGKIHKEPGRTHSASKSATKRGAWQCGPKDQAFAKVKAELAKPKVLALYDPAAESKISVDASSYGLGVVMQKEDTHNGKHLPICISLHE